MPFLIFALPIFALPAAFIWLLILNTPAATATAPTAPPVSSVRWQILETPNRQEAQSWAALGWEPYAVAVDRSSGQTYYHLRARFP